MSLFISQLIHGTSFKRVPVDLPADQSAWRECKLPFWIAGRSLSGLRLARALGPFDSRIAEHFGLPTMPVRGSCRDPHKARFENTYSRHYRVEDLGRAQHQPAFEDTYFRHLS